MQSQIQLFTKKEDCCGCNACAAVCPKQAITMVEDECGFRFPQVNQEVCVKCGSCQHVCCIQNAADLHEPIKTFAGTYRNAEISANSASGGIFAAIASAVINDGGVVYGSTYNDKFDVEVIAVDHIKNLHRLQGSKYVQSSMNMSYEDILADLKCGKQVLFCGVPCQVEALKRFLKHPYENLLLVDIVCHGVPSGKMLKDYLAFLEDKKKMEISSISFRTKEKGQNTYGEIAYRQVNHTGEIAYRQEPLVSYKSSYYKLFLNCQTFRESCYKCKFAGTSRPGDISLCDYWGIDEEHKEFEKQVKCAGFAGISAIMLNTKKGEQFYKTIEDSILCIESAVEKVAAHNPQLQYPSLRTKERAIVMDLYCRQGYSAVDEYYFTKYRKKILTSDIGQLLPNSWKKQILKVIKRIGNK